jgi:ribosomal protein S18 acetylase RimI-like enzyme
VSAALAAVHVRRARRDDWPAVRRLLREVDDLHAALAPDYFRSAARTDGDWARLMGEEHGAVLVAERPAGGGAVALLVARIYDTPDDPMMVRRRRLHIETVVVGRMHRRQGIGRRLMDEGLEWGRSRGAIEVVLTTWTGNAEAEAFYRGLGYRELSRVLYAPITGPKT